MNRFRRRRWLNYKTYLCLLYVTAALVYSASASMTPEDRGAFWAVASLPVLGYVAYVGFAFYSGRSTLEGRLIHFMDGKAGLEFLTTTYSGYRFVDLYQAVQRASETLEDVETIEAMYHAQLSDAFAAPVSNRNRIRVPSLVRRCTGFERQEYFAPDRFWLARDPQAPDGYRRLVIRVCYEHHGDKVRLEVACRCREHAERFVDRLVNDSIATSIFRGQLLELRFEPRIADDFGYAAHSAGVDVIFKERIAVTEAEIVLDDHVCEVLRRNVFDFHKHRDALFTQGIQRKRALLFHGPPGTGKTFTCQYIRTVLDEVTTIVVTGDSLTHMEDIAELARILQPTVVVLEDVDLVFTSREVNLYSTALGDFMDQLDGFHADEDVMFILTTNAIDRLEQAIKDRPGRINQCVYFGPPVAELRRRYLLKYLQPYGTHELDLDHLVRQTEGVTQAFLKEYVLRAVQIGVESAGYKVNGPVELQTSHFDAAFAELTEQSDKHTRSIIGFHAET